MKITPRNRGTMGRIIRIILAIALLIVWQQSAGIDPQWWGAAAFGAAVALMIGTDSRRTGD